MERKVQRLVGIITILQWLRRRLLSSYMFSIGYCNIQDQELMNRANTLNKNPLSHGREPCVANRVTSEITRRWPNLQCFPHILQEKTEPRVVVWINCSRRQCLHIVVSRLLIPTRWCAAPKALIASDYHAKLRPANSKSVILGYLIISGTSQCAANPWIAVAQIFP